MTEIGPETLLVNSAWIPPQPFSRFERIDVHPGEKFAANALRIGTHLVYSSSFPRTRERLEARGFAVHAVDLSELAKAEGAVTCCSLIIGSPPMS